MYFSNSKFSNIDGDCAFKKLETKSNHSFKCYNLFFITYIFPLSSIMKRVYGTHKHLKFHHKMVLATC